MSAVVLVRRVLISLVVAISMAALITYLIGGMALLNYVFEEIMRFWQSVAILATLATSGWGAIRAYRAWEVAQSEKEERLRQELIRSREVRIILVGGFLRGVDPEIILPMEITAGECTAQRIAGVLGYFAGGRRFEVPGLAVFLMNDEAANQPGGEYLVQQGLLDDVVIFGVSEAEMKLFAEEIAKKVAMKAAFSALALQDAFPTAAQVAREQIAALEVAAKETAKKAAEKAKEAKDKEVRIAEVQAVKETAQREEMMVLLRKQEDAINLLRAQAERAASQAQAQQIILQGLGYLVEEWRGPAKPGSESNGQTIAEKVG